VNFALILFVLTVVTGAVALVDRWFLAKRRRRDAPEPWWIEYPKSFFPVLLIVFLLRSFVAEPFKIPSSSMRPTLEVGDFILVNKFAYGIRLPIIEKKIIPTREPQRGDVVVFRYPVNPSQDFIKRVIGLPGEKVEIRDKKVYVDDQPLEESVYAHFIDAPLRHDDPEYGFRGEGQRDNWGPEVVPAGQLFVMGDNRDNSRDSRYWGYLPIDQVKGRALLVYWSLDASKDEYQRTSVVQWLKDLGSMIVHIRTRTRWERFFHVIR
jgi:signal peptidase I